MVMFVLFTRFLQNKYTMNRGFVKKLDNFGMVISDGVNKRWLI